MKESFKVPLTSLALCTVLCTVLCGMITLTLVAEPCPPNRAPLQSQNYYRLPMGSVKAKGWLESQLVLQKDGLTGHAEELYEDIGKSDWCTGESRKGQFQWERGPYYAKGLIALAYTLDDKTLKDKSQKWIDQVISSQREDGDFGPKERNWWANMIVLHYMRDYYEATGDDRVTPFLENYFRFQLKTLPIHTLFNDSKWAKARGGDNLEIVLWLYNLKGEKWLLELADLLIIQTNEWQKYYVDGTGSNAYPEHIVNVMQGLKSPPLMYLVSGAQDHRDGFPNATSAEGWLMTKCGRVDGMLNGEEPLSDRSSTGGTELCAIAERILASTVAMQILGEASIGDQLERIGYNALPAALSPDLKGQRYYILQNQPKCTNEKLGFRHNGNGKNALCPSPHSGYGCCRSNFHFAWPKFVHGMWMATADKGLALAIYGPNSVTAKVGSAGTDVTLDLDTDYPFRNTATLTVTTASPVTFPLELRIPGWCSKPSVQVNNVQLKGVRAGTFHRIERKWKRGDKIKVLFPMETKVTHGVNNSAAITRGPLIFSLLMEESWKNTASFLDDKFHTSEITPTGAWNYALQLNDSDKVAGQTTVADKIPSQPFKSTDAPIRLMLSAFKTDQGGWGTYRKDLPGRAIEPPVSPIKTSGKSEEITLVPYGSTEIRITLFPWAVK